MNRYNPNIYIGLTEPEVRQRKKEKLVNYKSDIPTKTIGDIIIHNTFTLFNMINLIIAFIIFLIHSYKNLLFMGVVICNLLISIIQEIRAKKIIDKLSIVAEQTSTVVRDGKDKKVSLNEIVLDDIIKYQSGNQVVVDSIIKKGSLEVDEANITGESNNILKKEGDMLLSGSFVISGEAICRVEHIGNDNYSYSISKDAKYIKLTNSIIMNTLKLIIKWISIIIIPLGILLFKQQMNLVNNDVFMAIINTSAAIIGMIPEGLVLLTSSVFAISSYRLAKEKILVQDLYCVETLGSVDTLCLDKTGTITEGDLEVVKIINLSNVDIDLILSTYSNYLKNDNKTMKAINEKYHLKTKDKVLESIPFSSSRKYSGIYVENQGSYIMGAADILLKDNSLSTYMQEYKNYRVLLLMHSKDQFIDYNLPRKMKPLGLIIMQDKIRQNAFDTLDYLKRENIDLKIISGDSSLTVASIASSVGINPKIIDMSNVNETDDLKEIVNNYNIFTRVLPYQKKDLIKALKLTKHRVAYIGDGVNDVLALKEADLSIALSSGSEAAMNVSQMVLLESNFKGIPSILREARITINNIERSSVLFLTKTIYTVILSIIFLFVSINYPFQLIQLSLTSAITIGIPSFMLALEKNSKPLKGNYVINVLSKSIPAALTIVINILFIVLLSFIYPLKNNEISTMSVVLVAFTGFLLLYRICMPLNKKRLLLLISLVIIFFAMGISFNEFFELVWVSFPKFILMGILFLLDIVLFFKMCDILEKVILKRKDKIIRRLS